MGLENRDRFSMLWISSYFICYIYLSSLFFNNWYIPDYHSCNAMKPHFLSYPLLLPQTVIWSLPHSHLHNLSYTKREKIGCQKWPYLQLNHCAGFMWPPKQPQYTASFPSYSLLSLRRRPSDSTTLQFTQRVRKLAARGGYICEYKPDYYNCN